MLWARQSLSELNWGKFLSLFTLFCCPFAMTSIQNIIDDCIESSSCVCVKEEQLNVWAVVCVGNNIKHSKQHRKYRNCVRWWWWLWFMKKIEHQFLLLVKSESVQLKYHQKIGKLLGVMRWSRSTEFEFDDECALFLIRFPFGISIIFGFWSFFFLGEWKRMEKKSHKSSESDEESSIINHRFRRRFCRSSNRSVKKEDKKEFNVSICIIIGSCSINNS